MENLNPRKSKKKWYIGIPAAIVILILLIIIMAPFYISSESGRQMVVGKINSAIDGKLNITNLSMGWFSGIKLTDVSFVDNAGAVSAEVKSVYAQPHYASMIFGDISLGQTVIDEPVIKVDLAKLQAKEAAAKPTPTAAKAEESQMPLSHIDLVINKGNFTVSDSSKAGKLAQLSDINTKLNLRPTGQQTTFNLNLVASENGKSAPVQVSGEVTPGKGWRMVDTSGDIRIDVNELDLGTLAPFMAMVDPNVKAKGTITINGTAKLDNGQIGQIKAQLDGRNIDVSLPGFKGDSFKTKKLTSTANVSAQGQIIKIDKLDMKADWATIDLKGIVPANAKSMGEFLSPSSPTELAGTIDIDMAAMLSQMPHAAGLKEGTKINSGRIKGNIGTKAEAGKKIIQADMVLSDVAGIVDGKAVSLSKPVELNGKISSEKNVISIDQLAVNSAFAQAKVSGTMEAIKYTVDADLTKTQGELGQFVDFGKYKLGGQILANGDVSVKPKAIAGSGTMTINQLAIASATGSATEPSAKIAYKINLDQKENVLGIDSFKVDTSFANVNITEATVPMAVNSSTPMKLSVAANADLAKVTPWLVMAGTLKPPLKLGGKLDSTLNVTSKGSEYHIQTDNTKIANLLIDTGTQAPFTRPELTLAADMLINPVEKTYKIKTFKLSSPGAVDIELIKFSQTNEGNTTKLDGTIKADYDWKAITAMAAPFLPAGLQMNGTRKDTITFNSQWPTNDPNKMLANMNAQAAIGWQSAEYMGFELGKTEINANIQSGKLTIPPFTTTMNNGTLNFGANADFQQKPALLTISQPMNILKDVQINDRVAAALLKNVNPIFASAKNTQGKANLECRELAIPLAGGTENDTRIDATVSVANLQLQSPLLQGIALATNKNISTTMTLQPSQIVMKQGVLSYDKMQLDLGEMSLIFSGKMGPGEKMNMSFTYPGLGGIALKGTKSKPELDLVKMGQLLLQQQLLGGKSTQDANQPAQQRPEDLLKKGLEGLLKGKK